MDFDVYSARYADDGPGARVFLWRAGEKEKCFGHNDAVVLRAMPDKYPMDTLGV